MATEAPTPSVTREESQMGLDKELDKEVEQQVEQQMEKQMEKQMKLEKEIEFQKRERRDIRDSRERRDLLDSRKDMMGSISAYSVVLVLLASITFVGFLQPPGGLKQDETAANGTLQRPGFYIDNFIVPLTISFYFAVAGILLCMGCVIFVLRFPQMSYQSDSYNNSSSKDDNEKLKRPLEVLKKDNEKLERALKILKEDNEILKEDNEMLHASLKWAGVLEVMINAFFTFSLFCCTLAFVFAGYTVTDGEQRKLFRRVIYVFETINGVLFITYTISLILSCFIAAPLCCNLPRLREELKEWFRKKGFERFQGFLRSKHAIRLTNQV